MIWMSICRFVRSSLALAVILLAVVVTQLVPKPAEAQIACPGVIVNPITDICWECAFPITLGGVAIVPSAGSVVDTVNPSSPVCYCGTPIPRIGITAGFWEPVRLLDASRKAGCFPNLGISIPLGTTRQGRTAAGGSGADATFMHSHYYIFPVWVLLEALVDVACLDPGNVFDIAWVSELDPTWNDDKLAFLLHPESALFGNPIAQAACTADCVAATAGLPLTELFWCAGCQGGMYPMSGNVAPHVGGVQAALLASQRMLYKLHRQLIAWGSYGQGALCQRFPMPIMDKRQYRLQLTRPLPMTVPFLSCNPPGRSSTHYEWRGGEFPGGGESWGFLLWRKRNCCLL